MQGRKLVTIAGPGTGKTHMMVARILNDQQAGMLRQKQVAVTFTNAAGDELAERLEKAKADRLSHCGTLHSWALRQLRRRRPDRYEQTRIIGDAEFEEIIKDAIKRIGSKQSIASAREIIANNTGTAGAKRVLSLAIQNRMRTDNVMHPDTVLPEFIRILDKGDGADQGLQLYIDEFQDTASIDAAIYRRLFDEYGASIFVVGDPRQAIFGFRGASWSHMRQMAAEADQVTHLEVNYRSTRCIVDHGNALAKTMLIDDEMKQPNTAHRNGACIPATFNSYPTGEEEAIAMREWAQGAGSRAILTRYNQGVKLIADMLRAEDIPVQASTDSEELKEQLREHRDMLEAIKSVDNRMNAQEWATHLGNLGASLELQDALVGPLSRARTPEQRVAAVNAMEPQPQEGAVWVSTIHAAKGLEWDWVWLAGADDKAYREGPDDKCLLFVAITRARDALTISHAESRQAHQRLTDLKLATILEITKPR